MAHKLRRVRVEEYTYCFNKLSPTLVWKNEYDVKNNAHQMQMSTIRHLLKPPHENFLRTPLCGRASTREDDRFKKI